MNQFFKTLFVSALLLSCGNDSNDETSQVKSGAPAEAFETSYDSKQQEHHSNIELVAGTRYTIKATLLQGPWNDAGESADFNGWVKKDIRYKVFGTVSKLNKLPFYSLVGCLGIVRADKCFKIGDSKTLIANNSGKLIVFVNDVLGFFGNNSGKAKISVETEPSVETGDGEPAVVDDALTPSDCTCTRDGPFGEVTCAGGPNKTEEPKCGGAFNVPMKR